MYANATIVGRLGRDPEEKTTKSGQQMVVLSVATTKSQKREKKTTWHRVLVFGRSAEFVLDWFHKGDAIIINGDLAYDEYASKDGTQNRQTVVFAKSVDFGPNAPEIDKPQDKVEEKRSAVFTDGDIPF